MAAPFTTLRTRPYMLSWAMGFLILAIIAGVLGFGGIAASSAGLAKILFVVFLVIFVATAYASSSSPKEEPVGPQVGTCVNVAAGPTTTVVPCDGPHEMRIMKRIPDGGDCPEGTEKRRLAVDGYLECVRVESVGG